MLRARAWLQLVRIHTSCLTQAIVMLGALLGGVDSYLRLSLFALWAALFHASGFVDNNICDYEYDLHDPSKKHFPLVTGKITLRQARLFAYPTMAIVTTMGLLLSNIKLVSVIFLLSAVLFGLVYNRVCKKTPLSPIPVTASFVSLPLFSYFSSAEMISPVLLPFTLYTIFYMLFDIGYLGYYKDIRSDRVNLLRIMGADYADGQFLPSSTTRMFGLALRLPNIVLALLILAMTGGSISYLLLTLMMASLLLYFVKKSLSTCHFEQEKITRTCALSEISAYFLLVASLGALIGTWGVLFFVLYPIAWFIIQNMATWGSILAPKV